MANSHPPARATANSSRGSMRRHDLRLGCLSPAAVRRQHPHHQLMLGHASIQQTQRYLNVTDEELRRGLEVSWNNTSRLLRVAAGQ
jgi:hypothetical protein